MKPNNVIYLKCTENSFYRVWMEFLAPFHKLTSRERDVAAQLLEQYFRLRDGVKDDDVLYDIMWSQKSRQDIRTRLGISQAHFQLVLSKLRTAGFLNDREINPRYIPHTNKEDNRFMLEIIYDWSASNKPIVSA